MGRIVKAAEADPAGAAEAIRAAARAEAEVLLASTRDEAARLLEDAREQGRREAAALAAAARAAAAAERARLEAEVEGEIVALALAVAGKVLACAVEDGRGALETARKALARVRGARHVTLRAHPREAEHLRAAAGELLPAGGTMAVVEDAAVGRGGLLVETEAGMADARLEAQLSAIGRRLGEAA